MFFSFCFSFSFSFLLFFVFEYNLRVEVVVKNIYMENISAVVVAVGLLG